MLDAGCGSGMVTFALHDVLRAKGLDYEKLDAFDLTPAMLRRFEKLLGERNVSGVQLQQADVLALQTLPSSWTNYDLILSASMLEYLPKQELPRALSALRSRLSPEGKLGVMINRKTPETKVLIDWLWHANRYTKPELVQALSQAALRNPMFRRFATRYFWLNRANYVVIAAP